MSYIWTALVVFIYAIFWQSNEVFEESSESLYLYSKNEYLDSMVYFPAAILGALYLFQVRTLLHNFEDP